MPYDVGQETADAHKVAPSSSWSEMFISAGILVAVLLVLYVIADWKKLAKRFRGDGQRGS